MLFHCTCLESLAWCDRQAFPTIHRMILLYVTLHVTASTAQRVWSWGGSTSQPSRRDGVSDYCYTLCKVVLPSHHRGERSAPHWQFSRPCHQGAGPGHPVHIRQKAQDGGGGFRRILLESSNSGINPSVTGFSSAIWAASGRTRHRAFQSPSCEKPILARRRLCEPLIGNSLPVLSPKISLSEGAWVKSITTIAWILHTGSSMREALLRQLRRRAPPPTKGHDKLTLFHLRHQGTYGIAFLTELFNLSLDGVDMQAIWKNFVIFPILKVGKPREQDREDLREAPPPDHCDGSRNAPLTAWF